MAAKPIPRLTLGVVNVIQPVWLVTPSIYLLSANWNQP